jgi:hypothetical protein
MAKGMECVSETIGVARRVEPTRSAAIEVTRTAVLILKPGDWEGRLTA